MSEKKFKQLLFEADIASIKNCVPGSSFILPTGMKIKNKLEELILQKYKKLNYSEVQIPLMTFEQSVEHLRTEELFKANNSHNYFYLVPGFETTSALLANQIISSHRDLPLKIFSRNSVFRQTTKTPFIKEQEMKIIEFNSFFEKKEEMIHELRKLNELTSNILQELNLPFVTIKESNDEDAQHKFYVYFPHSNKFGSTFCNVAVGNKYTSKFMKQISPEKNSFHPYQINASFTSRIFYAYLSNNMLQKGFSIDQNLRPYDLAINTNNMNSNDLEKITLFLESANLSYFMFEKENNSEALKKSNIIGVPLYLGKGRHEYKIRMLNSNVEWISPDNLESSIMNGLQKAQTQNVSKTTLKQYLDDSNVFVTPFSTNDFEKFIRIGFTPDGSKSVYITKKY